MSKKEYDDLKKNLEKRNFYTTNDASWVFFACLLVPFAVGFLFMYISMVATGTKNINDLFENNLWFAIPMVVLTEVVFLCVFLIYNKVYRIKQSSCNLSFKNVRASTSLWSILLGVLAVFGFIGLIEGALGNFYSWIGVKSSGLSLPNDTIGWMFVNILLCAVIPAICEELIFRGVIFQGLKETFSVRGSMLLTSLLFALMHQNLIQFVYPLLLGFVLCLVMEKTGNLLYPILLHMANNITTIVLSFLINIGVLKISFKTMPWWAYLIVVAIAAVAVCVFFVIYKFHYAKLEKEQKETEGQVSSVPSFRVGKFPLILIVSILLCVVMIVINAV